MISSIIAVLISAISGAVIYHHWLIVYGKWLKNYIEKHKSPALAKRSTDPEILEWINRTQVLVTAINDVVSISGRDVKFWSAEDIQLIAGRIHKYAKGDFQDER